METGTATCPTCNAEHRGEITETGVDIEAVPCQGNDDCTAKLCRSCRIKCAECGLFACSEHVHRVQGFQYCDICLAKDETPLEAGE